MNFLERMRSRPSAEEIAKATTVAAEAARIERLLVGVERSIVKAFMDFVDDLKNPYLVKTLADQIEAGDFEGAMRVIDSHIVRFAQVAPREWARVGAAEAQTLAQDYGHLKPQVAISFEVGNAVAAEAIQRAAMKFIVDITEKQREAIRAAMSTALAEGASSASAARAFRDAIGLTKDQMARVDRYRAFLTDGSRRALDFKLRDRRFDRSVDAAIEGRRPLTAAQIDKMVERYRARSIQSRAQTIARTEGLAITEGARDEAFRQMVETTGLDTSLIDEIWRATTSDDRTRETHRAMNGQVQPYGQPFESPSGATLRYPGDPDAPAEEVINCRCHKTRRIRKAGAPFTEG